MVNNSRIALDDKRIGRLLLKLSYPAFFGMFVTVLYNVVDTIFIGRYVGSLGIAGLSIVFPVQMLFLGIGQMTGMGGASVISRLLGARDAPRAEQALGNAITCSIALSVMIMTIGSINTDFWLRLIGSSETILPYAREYMTTILVGLVFQTFAMTLNALVRSEGNARVAMTGMIIGAVLNIMLDAVFIIPLNMGIRGAALATSIAQLVSSAYFVMYYSRGKSLLKVRSRNLVPEWRVLKRILAIGIASFARTLAHSMSAIIVNRTLIVHGADLAVSAYGIINRLMMFAIMPGIVIGQGLQPILGFNYGAKRYGMALKAVTIAVVAATIFSAVSFLFLYSFPEPLVRIFTADEELIALCVYAAKYFFLFLYLIGFMIVGSLIFQSIGKAVQSFITAVSRTALFLIPLVFILPRFLGLQGVWLAFPIADALTFTLTLALLIPQIRELRKKIAAGRTQDRVM